MKLTILGYYGGYPFNGGGTSGYLIQSQGFNLMLDAGSGTLIALQKILDPLQLDAVLLSHYHQDHIADVGVLQYEWQLQTGPRKQDVLPIYGHMEDPLNFAALTWPDATVGKRYDPNGTLELGPFVITFLRTIHPVPTFAIRVVERETGAVLVYTADSATMPALSDFAARADVLMVDTNFFANRSGQLWHMTAPQAGQLAQQAQVGTLILTHLPQITSFEELKQQASTAAGSAIKVLVAADEKNLEI